MNLTRSPADRGTAETSHSRYKGPGRPHGEGIIRAVNPSLKRTGVALLVLAVLQLACGATPSLWGTANTPTPVYPTVQSTQDPSLPSSAEAVLTPLTSLPAITPTAITSFITPTHAAPEAIEPTAAPTNDIAPVLYYSQSGDTLDAVAARFN